MSEPFELANFLPYRLAVLSERVSNRLARHYGRALGVSVAEWRVLAHVARYDRVSVREICHAANLDKPRASRAVGRLEEAGHLIKRTDARDHRLVSISLTDSGRVLLGQILPEALALQERLLGGLTPAQRGQLDEIVEAMHQVLDADPEAAPRLALDLCAKEDGNGS